MPRRISVAFALAAAVCLAAAAVPAHAGPAPRSWSGRVDSVVRYLETRAGDVSFAVVDERGRIHGRRLHRPAHSASVLKAILLVTYLREPGVRDRGLTASDRSLLEPMIRWSDNETATRTLHIVGASSVNALARRAGMTSFRLVWSPWGHSSITARDQARFFHRIDSYVPARHRAYALHLLATIVPSQRWGVGQVSRPGWNLYFKGGWGSGIGLVDHQVALLAAGGERISAAVLTRDNPGHAYGNETLRGVFARLFRGIARPRGLRGGAAEDFAHDRGAIAWLERGCDHVRVRELGSGRARAFGTNGSCAAVGRLALAGTRALWTRRVAAGERLVTAALEDPTVRTVGLWRWDGMDGDRIAALAGDRSLAAVSGTTYAAGDPTGGWVTRIVGGSVRATCAAPIGARVALSGSLVATADDNVAEVKAAGCAPRATVAPAGAIRALALGGDVLALLVERPDGTKRISLFDAETGEVRGGHTVPAETLSRLDVARGRVAYRVGYDVRVLDVARETSARAWTPRLVPRRLSLEGSRLAWVENRNGRARAWTLDLPE
jgi:hypothetical protein